MWADLYRLPERTLMALVRAYRFFLKPWLGNACRFEPTCSAYALVALQRHGAVKGGLLSVGRLLRCHPWCAGGCDPVPTSGLFTRLVPTECVRGHPGAGARDCLSRSDTKNSTRNRT